ncbi:MAG: ribosome recycling factor, partial [Bacillati bacterium ANGP1]
MQKTIDATRREFGAVRTGRATPALLERITVDYYGVQTPVNQVATVTAPDSRLLVVQPWD